MQQTGNKLALVFDNLETLQDPATGRVTDDAVAAWLDACQPDSGPAPVVLVTSRWAIPGWEGDRRAHRPLGTPLYGDFLRYHQQLGGAPWGTERLRRLYAALGGNFKGLEFFHALNQVAGDDEAFLQQLEQSRKELQLYMAVEKLVGYLQPDERELLDRLRAYLAPTFADGVRIVAQDLAEPERLLRRLVGLSLVEVEMEPALRLPRYRLSPVVADWLQEHNPEPASDIRQCAARHQLWVHDNLRPNIDQALIAHEALRWSGLDEEAARFALGVVIPDLNRIGSSRTLLENWLPRLRESRNQELRAAALNWSGNICFSISQYDEAKLFYEEALDIHLTIGDRVGEGTALNGIGLIYKAWRDNTTALRYLEDAFAVHRGIENRAEESTTLHNIGLIHQESGDGATALRYLEESFALNQIGGYWVAEGAILHGISKIYEAHGDNSTALEYLRRSLVICQDIGDRLREGAIFGDIGVIYLRRGEYATALKYLKESLAICRAIGDRAGLCPTLFSMGHIFLGKNEHQQALACFVEAYQIAKAIGYAEALMNLENLAKQLGGSGLEYWERLSQQMESGE